MITTSVLGAVFPRFQGRGMFRGGGCSGEGDVQGRGMFRVIVSPFEKKTKLYMGNSREGDHYFHFESSVP